MKAKYTFHVSFVVDHPLTDDELYDVRDIFFRAVADEVMAEVCLVEDGEHDKSLTPEAEQQFRRDAGYVVEDEMPGQLE